MFRLPLAIPSPLRPARAVVIAAAATLLALPALAGDWKGSVETVDGVKHVKNPAQPMETPLTVDLEEVWRIGGDTDDPDQFFGVINRVTTDDEGNIYLLDNQLTEVKIFSPEGEFIRTIGREGEGPGEFRLPQDMFLLPDGNVGVLQLAPGRIVMLTPEGDPMGEHPLPEAPDGSPLILLGAQLMGDHLVVMGNTNRIGEGKIDIVRYLTMIDSEGNRTADLLSETRTLEFANAVLDEKVWSTFDRRWQVGPQGRLYACPKFQGYEVHVWSPEGDKEMVISRDYEHIARDEAEKERIRGIFEAFTRQIPDATIKVSDDEQDVAGIYPRADGSLWVLSSRGFRQNPEGSIGVFDVYNRDGKFVRQVTLNGQGDPLQDGYFFVGDRLYVVTGFLDAAMAAQGGGTALDEDAEAEPMAVICYRLDVPEMGM